MKRNYLGKLLKDLSPGAQAVYQRLKAPFVRSRASRCGLGSFGSCLPLDSRQDFWGPDNISFCPHLSTSGAFWFSTRRCKRQQKPIIRSPFVFADYLSLWGFFSSPFLFHMYCVPPWGENPEAILWLIGYVSWFFENEPTF